MSVDREGYSKKPQGRCTSPFFFQNLIELWEKDNYIAPSLPCLQGLFDPSIAV